MGCDAVEDCDDQCASRCPGVSEACDGLDNDCSGTVDADADADGIPDALDPGVPVLGTVSSAEIDLDGDLALSCVESFRPGAPQTQTVPFTCGLPVELGPTDCNALCYLAAPGATEACNGFLDLCGATAAEREGLDQDEDGYVTCGAYGPADGGLVEQVFVPVWRTCQAEAEDTDAGASDDDPACAGVDAVDGGPSLVPLIPPRPGGLPCDEPLTEAQDVLLARVGAVRAEVGDATALVGSLCRPESGGVCTVVVLELDATNVVDVDPALSTVANDVSAACAAQPAALTTRTVWPRERVVDARRATVALECLRLFGLPCAEVTPTTPRIGSAEPPDLGDRLAESIGWWPELRRYRPSVAAGALMTCWGDPSVQAISLDVGGDCDDSRGNVHRDLPEGPDDVVTAYARLLGEGSGVDCAACFDQVDNNCDGLTDCADPTCAVCFVGGGTGCASGRDACKPPGEGCTAVGNRPGVAALLLFGLFVRRRRRDAAARQP